MTENEKSESGTFQILVPDDAVTREPTDNEKLIAATGRLEQCLANREAGIGAWSMVRPEDVRAVLDALEAAEKAHTPSTPTDDERKSLTMELFEELVNYGWPITDDGIRDAGDVAEVLYRAGFRRTSVPGTSAEPTDAQVEAACVAFYEDVDGLTSWGRLSKVSPDIASAYRISIRAALRAASAVTDQGEGSHG